MCKYGFHGAVEMWLMSDRVGDATSIKDFSAVSRRDSLLATLRFSKKRYINSLCTHPRNFQAEL